MIISNFNGPDTVFINSENKITLSIAIAIPLNHNLSNIEAAKTKKDENVALEIKNVLKLHNALIYPVVTTAEGVVTRNFLNSREYRFNQKVLRVGKTAVQLQKCHIVLKFLRIHVCCFDNCVGVWVICVHVFIVFLYCFIYYIYSYLLLV
jgi:hypothetical protein